MKIASELASFDSATAMVRVLARFLAGRDARMLGNPRTLATLPIMLGGNHLPWRVRERMYSVGSGMEAQPTKDVARLRTEDLASAVAASYPRRRYPGVAIGSSNGALSHLCAALGIPWLPQTVLVPVRQRGVDPEDAAAGLQRHRELGERLVRANPDVALHQMHDPNQDRLTLRHAAYFRIKRRTLGDGYRRFLEERVEPGGTVLIVDTAIRWPVTEVAERYWFQVGAVGGATPDEYVHGGDRVAAHLRRYGSDRSRWRAVEPTTERPEAEWGYDEALTAEIVDVARERNLRVRRLRFGHPGDLSPMVADLHRWWYQERGIPPQRLLVESFVLVEPWWALRTASTPFWMPFNTEDDADRLERYLADRTFEHIDLTALPNGVHGVGLASIDRWQAVVERARTAGRFVGIDPRLYPLDLAAFARFHGDVVDTPARYPMPGEPLSFGDIDRFLQSTEHRYDISYDDVRPGAPVPSGGDAS